MEKKKFKEFEKLKHLFSIYSKEDCDNLFAKMTVEVSKKDGIKNQLPLTTKEILEFLIEPNEGNVEIEKVLADYIIVKEISYDEYKMIYNLYKEKIIGTRKILDEELITAFTYETYIKIYLSKKYRIALDD